MKRGGFWFLSPIGVVAVALLMMACSDAPVLLAPVLADASSEENLQFTATGTPGADAWSADSASEVGTDVLDPAANDASSPDYDNGPSADPELPNGSGCLASCSGKQCGHDGCGGSCGLCGPQSECDAAFKCVCVPDCTGKQCGLDGCGGQCGGCSGNTICQGTTCVCAPSCNGKQCGSDGCGGNCGSCPGNTICQGTLCMCQPSCSGKICGSDGCNGSCGNCSGGKACDGGKCVCVPQCNGKDCGSDGCGGQCGSCQGYQSCQSGSCIGWKWEAESSAALGHEQGKKDGDGWSCNTGDHSENYMIYGPYLKEAKAGSYLAQFRLQVDNNTAGGDKVARIEVYDANSQKKLKEANVYRNQFNAAWAYQDFALSFTTDGNDSLELRIWWYDTAYIKVDRVTVSQ